MPKHPQKEVKAFRRNYAKAKLITINPVFYVNILYVSNDNKRKHKDEQTIRARIEVELNVYFLII